MKKFKFQYESVLRLRNTKETLAKRDYAKALDEQRQAELELQNIYDTIEQYRRKSFENQNMGGNTSGQSLQISDYIEGAYLKADRKKDEIERLSSITQHQHGIYMETYKDRKAMEKLEEKQEKKYIKKQKKKAEKMAEDMVMARVAVREES